MMRCESGKKAGQNKRMEKETDRKKEKEKLLTSLRLSGESGCGAVAELSVGIAAEGIHFPHTLQEN